MRNSTRRLAATVIFTVLATAPAAEATNTVGCDAKKVWRLSIIETIVGDWYHNKSRTADLIDLISAEQGLAVCALGRARGTQLHTSTLPRSLQPEELGALLLANELEWAQLLPAPQEGLSGHSFQVIVPPLRIGGR